MDAHVAWYRAQLTRAVVRRLLAEALVVAVLAAAAYVVIRPGWSPVLVLAVVVAVCAIRVGVASYTNPLDRRGLRRYLAEALDCVLVPADGVISPAAAPLVDAGYAPVAAAGASGDDTVHYDLLAAGNGLVLAVVARASGSVMLLSALRDGRVVVSSPMQVLPTARLVSNTVRDASATELLENHWGLLRMLVASPFDLRPVPHDAFMAVLAEERAAYRALGPLATYLDLTCRGRSARFVVSIAPDHVLALDLAASPPRAASASATEAQQPPDRARTSHAA